MRKCYKNVFQNLQKKSEKNKKKILYKIDVIIDLYLDISIKISRNYLYHDDYTCSRCRRSFVMKFHDTLNFRKINASLFYLSSAKMSRQIFLVSPKFNKKLIYASPTNKYQEFTNAYIYSIMVKTGNCTPNHVDICREAAKEWNKIKGKGESEIDDIIRNYLITYTIYKQ